ncbi:hypothetical protein N656DRAFT_234048 [Canariomyces notabilis]|uniref:Uncharacterized protein n=1 Tax=Canariomyces notabilis TaxID=2074819 RepID=A0AAN6TKN9_9PEZI|nr:hypothetical protein N656DRAFT_234048 [Canariomyces arenarius]
MLSHRMMRHAYNFYTRGRIIVFCCPRHLGLGPISQEYLDSSRDVPAGAECLRNIGMAVVLRNPLSYGLRRFPLGLLAKTDKGALAGAGGGITSAASASHGIQRPWIGRSITGYRGDLNSRAQVRGRPAPSVVLSPQLLRLSSSGLWGGVLGHAEPAPATLGDSMLTLLPLLQLSYRQRPRRTCDIAVFREG